MSKVITLNMLIEKKACEEQFNLFKEYFGDSVEITEELCLKYYDKFDIDWLVDNMLNVKQRKYYFIIERSAYKPYLLIRTLALESYKDIEGPAWKAYKEIEGPAWKAYKEIEGPAWGPAWEAYMAIQAPAHEDYNAIELAAYRVYLKTKARAFYIAYNS